MSYTKYYQDLSNAYEAVINKSNKGFIVDNAVGQLEEIYGGKYGYRQTAAGRWRERDEPDKAEQDRQADAIRKSIHKKKAQQSRDRLKASNKVPTKGGKRMFEDFMREVHRVRPKQDASKNDEGIKQLYLAARALELDKFCIYVKEML